MTSPSNRTLPSSPVPISTTRFTDPFTRTPPSSYSRSPTSPLSARKGSISNGSGYIKSPPLIPPLPENNATESEDGSRRGSEAVVDGDGGEEEGGVMLGKRDRRMSREWDASQTVPSRFQKVEGSIWATPASRDGKVDRNKVHGFKEKVKELTGVKSDKTSDK